MATETLRPNAAGDETAIASQYPDADAHWDKVDEVVADDATTYIYTIGTSYERDLFNLPAHSVGSGAIARITVFFRCFGNAISGVLKAKASIKSGLTVADGDEEIISEISWTNYSHEWTLNPEDSNAWEWADIDALQIGLQILAEDGVAACTQVYVEVDYTLTSTHTGTIGVTDIGSVAKFCGKPITDIAVIGGVSNV